MQEQWTKWEPIQGLAPKYELESISDTFDAFRVILFDVEDCNKKVHIIFEESVHSYTRTDESFRSDLISNLTKCYGSPFYGNWAFFKITNSSYLHWLSEQSSTLSDHFPMQHFALITMNSIVDIITNYEPRVELITT